MRSNITRDKNRRCTAERSFVKRKLIQFIQLNVGNSAKIPSLNRKGSFSKTRQRCMVTGRPRSVNTRFGLARQTLRILANRGQISGLYRNSW